MPKAIRELTTVYTGLSSDDFLRFSALATAKCLSRSELAREAIKFYLTWQQQAITWEGSDPIAHLLQRMNEIGALAAPDLSEEPANYEMQVQAAAAPIVNELLLDLETETAFQEDSQEESGSARSEQDSRLEYLAEKIDGLLGVFNEKFGHDKAPDAESQTVVEQKLSAIEELIGGLVRNLGSSVSAGEANGAGLREQLQEVERRISSLLSRNAVDVSINSARVVNLQEQLGEVEKSIEDVSTNAAQVATLQQQFGALARSMEGEFTSKIDHKFSELAALISDIAKTPALLDIPGEVRGADIREQLQATEGRICNLVTRGLEDVSRSNARASGPQADSGRMEVYVRELLKKIAIELSLLHFVLWKNQHGDKDQIFDLAQAKANERVKKWLEELQGVALGVMHNLPHA